MDKQLENDFKNFVNARLNESQKKLEHTPEYQNIEDLLTRLSKELSQQLPPELQLLFSTLDNTRREREYLSLQTAYEQALQDIFELSRCLK